MLADHNSSFYGAPEVCVMLVMEYDFKLFYFLLTQVIDGL